MTGLAGAPPGREVGSSPQQERRSAAVAAGSPWVQAVVVLVLLVVFVGFGFRRGSGYGRWLAGGGVLAVVGLFGYLGFLASSGAKSLGVVVLGRPLPWLGLQLVAVGVVVALVVTAVGAWRARAALGSAQRVRAGVLVGGGVLFVPWAVHWGLLAV